jgi:hypothetical protein
VKRKAPVIVILFASVLVTGCGVTPAGAQLSGPTTKPDPDVNLSARPCSIQTLGLLNQSQVPPNLTPTGPASSEVGPQGLLDSGTDGSVGNANEYFKAIGFEDPKTAPANQVSQFAEEVTDYGTVATAEQWMSGQEETNRPNDIPMYGNGVERVVATSGLGDETLLYQIDDGAPYNSSPFTGPFVGHIYTDIQVRDGDVIYALSIDSGPDADPASLAVSLVRALIAKEHAVCG